MGLKGPEKQKTSLSSFSQVVYVLHYSFEALDQCHQPHANVSMITCARQC